MRALRRKLGSIVLLGLPVMAAMAVGVTADPEARFREANDLARAGDYPKAIALYRELASAGQETAAVFWNWSQAAAARGAAGEALWAALRVRELTPWDRAAGRRIAALRESLSLDPAELAPEPFAGLARWNRRLHVDLVAGALFLLSVPVHGVGRLVARGRGGPGRTAWALGALAVLASIVPVLASTARPTGVVIRRGAPLLDAASPTAEVVGSLREGEVVPILGRSGAWRRIQDSSGARGWAHVEDVAPVEGSPE